MSLPQQALILETIAGIRKKLKRKDYDSDSDSSIERPTNRGNKLKKKARFVKQGRLVSTTGPAAYKETVEHAGYQRPIIHRNPHLIDQDGYDIESDDDEEQVQEALSAAADENPYSEVRLEQIFAPLTSVTDLPNHPAMSKPYTSKALTELVDQARELMQRESKALWKAKPLLTQLVGDKSWAPCGLMIEETDALLFTDPTRYFNRPSHPRPTTAVSAITNGVTSNPDGTNKASRVRGTWTNNDHDSDPVDGEVLPDAPVETNGRAEGRQNDLKDEPNGAQQTNGAGAPGGAGDDKNGDIEMVDASRTRDLTAIRPEIRLQPPHINGTLPEAAAITSDPFSPDAPFIHPMFLVPQAAHQDRLMGLPDSEAEECRRWLQIYVQKQEEVVRNATKLYEQLLRAERLRKKVLMWSKAEAHCGPNRDMSDGEDWYDREEWGLTEDLKKGEDEVEEDQTQQQKKTRNRK
ncbi:RXT2-like protein [Podospora australis]|uniref:RXT2-like protein n=1 Tax=Podospora australis TaxID=1536484 RepID=A0AAN6WSA0_9PEZI|nr:RXT2-like protein [Podospora australis]